MLCRSAASAEFVRLATGSILAVVATIRQPGVYAPATGAAADCLHKAATASNVAAGSLPDAAADSWPTPPPAQPSANKANSHWGIWLPWLALPLLCLGMVSVCSRFGNGAIAAFSCDWQLLPLLLLPAPWRRRKVQLHLLVRLNLPYPATGVQLTSVSVALHRALGRSCPLHGRS